LSGERGGQRRCESAQRIDANANMVGRLWVGFSVIIIEYRPMVRPEGRQRVVEARASDRAASCSCEGKAGYTGRTEWSAKRNFGALERHNLLIQSVCNRGRAQEKENRSAVNAPPIRWRSMEYRTRAESKRGGMIVLRQRPLQYDCHVSFTKGNSAGQDSQLCHDRRREVRPTSARLQRCYTGWNGRRFHTTNPMRAAATARRRLQFSDRTRRPSNEREIRLGEAQRRVCVSSGRNTSVTANADKCG